MTEVFGQEDRVQTPANAGTEVQLPRELVQRLEGKTPQQQTAEIAKFYQQREQTIIQTARDAVRNNNPNALPPERRPDGTTVRMERSTEQPGQPAPGELDGARATLRETAKRTSAQGKKYWNRFADQIEAAIKQMSPECQVNYEYWDAMYYNLLGQNKDAIEREEAEAAATAARQASERPSPGTETTQPPPPLPALAVSKVIPGLGISEKQYREGETAIQTGKFPFTYDSKVGRQV